MVSFQVVKCPQTPHSAGLKCKWTRQWPLLSRLTDTDWPWHSVRANRVTDSADCSRSPGTDSFLSFSESFRSQWVVSFSESFRSAGLSVPAVSQWLSQLAQRSATREAGGVNKERGGAVSISVCRHLINTNHIIQGKHMNQNVIHYYSIQYNTMQFNELMLEWGSCDVRYKYYTIIEQIWDLLK